MQDADNERLESWKRRAESELGCVLEPLYVAAPPGAGHVAAGTTTLAEIGAADSQPAGIDLRELAHEPAPVQLAGALGQLVSLIDGAVPSPLVAYVPVRYLVSDLVKLRALRRLVARVSELAADAGIALPPFEIHAFVADLATPPADLAGNLIHNAAAVCAAVVGGADRVTARAFDATEPEHARLADNAVRLALHEAHLAAVSDPAAGSYAFETLTEALCHSAWARFQGAAP